MEATPNPTYHCNYETKSFFPTKEIWKVNKKSGKKEKKKVAACKLTFRYLFLHTEETPLFSFQHKHYKVVHSIKNGQNRFSVYYFKEIPQLTHWEMLVKQLESTEEGWVKEGETLNQTQFEKWLETQIGKFRLQFVLEKFMGNFKYI